MTQHFEGAPARGATPDDAGAARAAADLERAYAAVPPPHLGEAMDRAVYQRLAARPGLAPRRRPRLLARGRLASLAAALLLALSGITGYLRLSSPSPASAQTILRRAAALSLAPGQAAHFTYAVALSGLQPRTSVRPPDETSGSPQEKGDTALGTAEVWIQADASGAPGLSAQTLTLAKNPASPAALFGRYIQVDGKTYAYDPGHNAILLGPEARENPSWVLPNDLFDGAGTAQYLTTLAARSPQRVQLLPQQTLDGVTVDAILVDGWTDRPAQRTTLYFDAQTYVLRGFDAVSNDPSYPTPAWQVRLSAARTMAATAVPPGTFALDAPATARVQLDPVKGDLFTAFAAACHSAASTKDVLKNGQQTLLAACQATAPEMTATTLVSALVAPQQHSLDAAVAAGVISAAQAADSLAAQQARLTTWISITPSQGRPASRK